MKQPQHLANSLRHATKSKVWGGIFGASAVGALGGLTDLSDYSDKHGVNYWVFWGLALISVVLTYFIMATIHYYKNNHSPSGFNSLTLNLVQKSLSKLQKVDEMPRIHDDATKEEQRAHHKKILNELMDVCGEVKSYFDFVTGGVCCVSIKVSDLTYSGQNPYKYCVQNIVRDPVHQHKRDTIMYSMVKHEISKNTAFRDIIRRLAAGTTDEAKLCYINSDIAKTVDYENTSLQAYSNLPYNSELVVPIIANYKDIIFENAGFFCIDCNKKFNFGTQHAALTQIIASAMFKIISIQYSLMLVNDRS